MTGGDNEVARWNGYTGILFESMPGIADHGIRSIALLALATGCAADPDAARYPTLAGYFADESAFVALTAESAWVDDTHFLVNFTDGKQLFHGSGAAADRIILPANAESHVVPSVVPMVEIRKGSGTPPSDGAYPFQILPADAWRSLRDRLVTGRIELPDLLGPGRSLLDATLDEWRVEGRYVLFNTGDKGYYSLPFILLDRERPAADLVRISGRERPAAGGGKTSRYVQAASHLAASHTTGILFRPVSSVYRLLHLTTDTVATAVKPGQPTGLDDIPIPPLNDGPGMDLGAWEARLTRITGRGATRGTIDLLIDGKAFFDRFTEAVAGADSSVSLRTYIFDDDDYAARVGELLKRRSNEGINVRVLLDGLGTMMSTIEEQGTLPVDYEPPVSVHQFLEAGSAVDVRQSKNPWLTGDHVKTAIIDNRIAFTGGMNIAREYRYDWHDLMVELRGPIVAELRHEFDKAWAHAGLFGDLALLRRWLGRKPAAVKDIGYPIRTLYTRTNDAEIFAAQREAIRRSQQYIFVENAYFTDDAMLYELAKARRRGVDVRVIVPLVTDRGAITRSNVLAANAMLQNGIRVFVYPGMSHVKAAIYDDWACLGSANWDRWSFQINQELNIATAEPAVVNALRERVFEVDFAASVELKEPVAERWSDHLMEIIGDYVF